MFVQCLLSKELWFGSEKKKKQGRLHIWGLGIENMASFSQFKNYVEEGRKSCRGFEFLLMCPDGDYEIQ